MDLRYLWSKLAKRLQGKSIRGSSISQKAFVNYGSNIVNSSMKDFSYCGYDCWIIEADIGKFCSISNQVHVGGPAHPTEWVSTSPVFHKGRNILGVNFAELDYDAFSRTTIGNDVWIGENVMVRAGITIGDGAVVGMGSIVTKDIPPYEIWAGNPAKKIRDRFDADTKEKLLKSQWWDWEESKIRNNASYVNDSEKFLRGEIK